MFDERKKSTGKQGVKNAVGNRNSTVVVTKHDNKENNPQISTATVTVQNERNVMGAQTIWTIGDENPNARATKTFQGSGNSLGGDASSLGSRGIVRKLPGLGIITMERHEVKNDRPRIIGRSTVEKHKAGGQKRKKTFTYVSDSSDEEFDSTLKRLSIEKTKKRKLSGGVVIVANKEQLNGESPIGSTVKVMKFKSVSNKNSPSSIKNMKNRSIRLGSSFTDQAASTNSMVDSNSPGPSNIKKMKSDGTDLAEGRNRRILLKDSDSDCSTDDDERIPLGAVKGNLVKGFVEGYLDKGGGKDDILDDSFVVSDSHSISSENGRSDEDVLLLGPSTSQGTGTKVKKSSHKTPDHVDDGDEGDDPIQICPICDSNFRSSQINNHLDECAEMEDSLLSHPSHLVLEETTYDDAHVPSFTEQVQQLEAQRVSKYENDIAATGVKIIDVTEHDSPPDPSPTQPEQVPTPEEVFTIPDNGGNAVNCPVCQRSISQNDINQHLDQCMMVVDDDPEPVDVLTDPSVAVCPVCQTQISAEQINTHLDQCLT